MTSITTRIATIAAGAIVLSSCGITGPAHTRFPAAAADATVTMGLSSFNPPTVRIRPGQTVLWRNTSPIGHTVTADPARAANRANIRLPAGAPPFHSGMIPAGQIWSYRFRTPGTYRYVCLPHERQGMAGVVVVG